MVSSKIKVWKSINYEIKKEINSLNRTIKFLIKYKSKMRNVAFVTKIKCQRRFLKLLKREGVCFLFAPNIYYISIINA